MRKLICIAMIAAASPLACEAVMPPSTSLEEPVRAVSAHREPGGRYQVISGRVTLSDPVKGKTPRDVETILKLDKETGKTWMLEVLPDSQRRWVELKNAS